MLLRLVMVGILWILGTRANGETTAEEVERLAREAGLAYQSADYSRAAELLEQAYRIRQVAALLYNAAKAYEKLGLLEKAGDRYRRYVESSDSVPGLRGKAEARLAAFEEVRQVPPVEATPLAPTRNVERPASPQKAPEAKPTEVKTAPVVSGERPEDPHKSRSVWQSRFRDRVLGSALFGTGLVIAGIGAGLSVSAYLLHQELATTADETKRGELKRSAEGQAISGDALYGLAAASVGVGIYFMWRGFRSDRPPRHATVVPTVGRSSAGLLFDCRF